MQASARDIIFQLTRQFIARLGLAFGEIVGVKRILAIRVIGDSMLPTLQDQQKMLAYSPTSKAKFRKNQIVTVEQLNIHIDATGREQFDYAKWLEDPRMHRPELFVKRITAMHHEVVKIPVEDVLSDRVDPLAEREDNCYVWLVPEGYVFVRGDSNVTVDSTSWGPIPVESLKHIVVCKLPTLQSVN